MSCLVAGSTNSRTERPVDGPPSSQSCVSMPVELADKYEDKDEDVDAIKQNWETRGWTTGHPARGNRH